MIRELLQIQITEAFGLVPGSTWPALITEALQEMSRRHGLDEDELTERISGNTTLLRELAGYLTVDESYFLRHSDQYPAFLDALELQVARHGQALVWSLGCARGEEPYTLAILVRERLGASAACVRILASDINARALTTAKHAYYRDWSFRSVPTPFIERHFQKEPNGAFRVNERARQAVEFEWAALPERLAAVAPQSVDFIFFRNVAIYFESQALARVYERVAAILKPGGFLFTAPADPAPPRDLYVKAQNDWTGVFTQRSSSTVHGACTAAVTVPQHVLVPSAAPVPTGKASQTRPAARVSTHRSATTAHGRSAVSPSSPVLAPRGTDSVPPGVRFAAELERANALIESSPTSGSGYLLRGRLYLSVLRAEEAARDFRSALYFDPNDVMIRFWYAAALHRAGRMDLARTQVLRLTEDLEGCTAESVLSDGTTRASKLLDAVLLMRASLS